MTNLDPGRMTQLPLRRPAIGDLVLGHHLGHLRATRRLTADEVHRRLPARRYLTPRSLADMEAGRNTVLRRALDDGLALALARAYGSIRAADDWEATLDTHHRDCETGTSNPDLSFADTGPGSLHRYQLLEQAATTLVVTVAGDLMPAPLHTEAMRQQILQRLPSARAALRSRRRVYVTNEARCGLCILYNDGLPLENNALWQYHVDMARSQAFTARLERPGGGVVALINESLLHTYAQAGTQPWTGQLQHVARLAEGTGLSVRIVPLRSGQTILVNRVELRFGQHRTVTVTPCGPHETLYEDMADDRLTAQRRAALGHRESLELLRRAAVGTLELPW
ncbi:Scr1 family TA system antitoxin-like transcriptional regulator [Kitasatospora sp. NPDC056783]|uniref:Scr1 family TA system antitoxin-like transcriptional regulator n=1 Tax=Kitasatospora sp. NPDC056783 TaxID=3345943 RepID=UPI0036B1FEAF